MQYVDGATLVAYAKSAPIASTDPSGMVSEYKQCLIELEACYSNPTVQELLRQIREAGAPDPHISCLATDDPRCGGGECGHASPGLIYPSVYLCPSCPQVGCAILIHELIHILQYAQHGAWGRGTRGAFWKYFYDGKSCVQREWDAYNGSGSNGIDDTCTAACNSCLSSGIWKGTFDDCIAYCHTYERTRIIAGVVMTPTEKDSASMRGCCGEH